MLNRPPTWCETPRPLGTMSNLVEEALDAGTQFGRRGDTTAFNAIQAKFDGEIHTEMDAMTLEPHALKGLRKELAVMMAARRGTTWSTEPKTESGGGSGAEGRLLLSPPRHSHRKVGRPGAAPRGRPAGHATGGGGGPQRPGPPGRHG